MYYIRVLLAIYDLRVGGPVHPASPLAHPLSSYGLSPTHESSHIEGSSGAKMKLEYYAPLC